ncbi:MAG: hypothetical protein Tsb0014_37160 [Pleurocapsa sp.]
MISKIEKLVYNRYFCYSPVAGLALIVILKLASLSPIKCFFYWSSEQCIVIKSVFYIIYHPINIALFLFAVYNILYFYYNITLGKNIVGKSVRKIYKNTTNKYYIKSRFKKLTILLFCYSTALILSYLRFPIVLRKAIY